MNDSSGIVCANSGQTAKTTVWICHSTHMPDHFLARTHLLSHSHTHTHIYTHTPTRTHVSCIQSWIASWLQQQNPEQLIHPFNYDWMHFSNINVVYPSHPPVIYKFTIVYRTGPCFTQLPSGCLFFVSHFRDQTPTKFFASANERAL